MLGQHVYYDQVWAVRLSLESKVSVKAWLELCLGVGLGLRVRFRAPDRRLGLRLRFGVEGWSTRKKAPGVCAGGIPSFRVEGCFRSCLATALLFPCVCSPLLRLRFGAMPCQRVPPFKTIITLFAG